MQKVRFFILRINDSFNCLLIGKLLVNRQGGIEFRWKN